MFVHGVSCIRAEFPNLSGLVGRRGERGDDFMGGAGACACMSSHDNHGDVSTSGTANAHDNAHASRAANTPNDTHTIGATNSPDAHGTACASGAAHAHADTHAPWSHSCGPMVIRPRPSSGLWLTGGDPCIRGFGTL